MNIQCMRYLRGPNIHAPSPILEVIFDTAEESRDGNFSPTIRSRVFQALSENSAHRVGYEVPEAFARAIVLLQQRVGLHASFQSVRATSQADRFLIAVECPLETVGQAAAAIALRLLNDARTGDVAVAPEEIQHLKNLEYQQRLPSSTAVVYHAARRRGIPARRLSPEYGRFLLLGHGSKQHRCQASEPDSVSAVARTASTDKYLAKELMAAAGVPVPVGKIVATVEDAWSTAQELGLPVAIKPQDSDLQIGVSLDLRDREQVEAAFHAAHEHSRWVIVERFAPGVEHRVLVVDGAIAAVTRIDPPHVVGDGTQSVAELVAAVNRDPRRGDEGSGLPWSKLKLDDVALGVLAVQGFDLASVPSAGLRVLVRRNPPYFKNGGNLIDLTDEIHPSIAAHAAAAAEALQLRVAGLDVVAIDIREPLEPQRGVIVEINAGPGLWLHLAPWADSPRPVGDAIVASMFPPGQDGRIPVIAVVGDGGGDRFAIKHLQAVLALGGLRVGQVSPTQIAVAGRHWPAPADPHERVQQLFQFPGIDVAIVETTADELLRFGFGNDRCDIVLSLAASTFRVIEDDASLEPTEFMKALRHALIPGGRFVTLAQDEAAVVRAGVPSSELFLVTEPSNLNGTPRAIAIDDEGTIWVSMQPGTLIQLGKCPSSLSDVERQSLLAALAVGMELGIQEAILNGYVTTLRS